MDHFPHLCQFMLVCPRVIQFFHSTSSASHGQFIGQATAVGLKLHPQGVPWSGGLSPTKAGKVMYPYFSDILFTLLVVTNSLLLQMAQSK